LHIRVSSAATGTGAFRGKLRLTKRGSRRCEERESNEFPVLFRGLQQLIKGNRMTVTRIDRQYEFLLSINGDKEPKQLDITQMGGQKPAKITKCIFKIVDRKLIIAEGKTKRPTFFETGPRIPTKVSTYRRKS
jgi:uncharacterized protein (TIGR03067 family)